MNKSILITSAVCFMFFSGMTQNDDSRVRSQFGIKLGSNYSNVYDANGDEFRADAKLGFAAGIFASIPLGETMGIQPELLFSQRGFKASGRLLGSTYEFTRTTNFIDVPLLFSVKPVSFISFLAGPQFSYLLSRKDVFTNSFTTVEQKTEFSNEEIRKNILGFTGGVDINVKHIVVSARAGWDFMSNHGDGTSSTPRYKNAWLQGTIGYRF